MPLQEPFVDPANIPTPPNGSKTRFYNLDGVYCEMNSARVVTPIQSAITPIPFGSYQWFKGEGNEDFTQPEEGDVREKLKTGNLKVREKYNGTNWVATQGED